MDNVTLEKASFISIGTLDYKFTGLFEGNGKTITMNGCSTLFNYVSYGAVIRNFTVEANDLRNAAIVNYSYGSEQAPVVIEYVTVNGAVKNARTVFVVTPYGVKRTVAEDRVKDPELIIRHCTNNASVTNDSSFYAPGVTAFVDTSYWCSILFEDCLNTGALTAVTPREAHGGAYLRYVMNNDGGVYIQLIGCVNTGSIDITSTVSDGRENVGGLIGTAHSGAQSFYLENCINTGSVKGTTKVAGKGFAQVGGLIGRNNSSITFVNCENSGDVTAISDNSVYAYVGGLLACGGATVRGGKVSGTLTASSVSGAHGSGALFGTGGKASNVSDVTADVTVDTELEKGYCLFGDNADSTGKLSNVTLNVKFADGTESRAYSWDAEGNLM